MQVYACDDTHVALPPFAAAELYLLLEEFEDAEPELRLGNLEVLAKDGAGFVLHEEEGAVGVGFCNLLQEREEGGSRMEEAGGVGLDRRGREGGCGVAEFVHGWFGWWLRGRRGGGGGCGLSTAVGSDWEGRRGVGRGARGGSLLGASRRVR